MTHEQAAHGEAEHGPEHTHDLPDADTVTVHALAEDSDLPPLPEPDRGADDPDWWWHTS